MIENFSMFDDWMDKYEYLIDLGRSAAPYPEEKKTEDRLIRGCQSRVWLDYRLEGGRLYFQADSDAIITKGLIAMIVNVYSGRTAEEIAASEFSFIDRIGLKENLSPTRAGGLAAMLRTIRRVAEGNLK